MADDRTQLNIPTVMVKKFDGTFARVPLSELKKQQSSIAPIPALPVSASIVIGDTTISPGVAVSRPVGLPRHDKTESVASDAVIIIKPVEPQMPVAPSIKPPNATRADGVIKQLSFSVSTDYTNRLRSIVQLRLKDIRDNLQTKSTAMRPIEAGGLGLTENQADELLKKCASALAVASSLLLAPEPEQSVPSHAGAEALISARRPSVPAPVRVPPSAPDMAGRAVMRDMVEREKTMGPLEEIEYFTLTDLRRLSSDSAQAATRLGQKFVNLREESYLLFLEAKTRWRRSPLFKDYLRLVAEALMKKIKLGDLAVGNDNLSLMEIEAILEMERGLK